MATYAVLPSHQDHTGHFSSHPLSRNPNSPSRSQRPKLSLNTSVNRSSGKGTTSVSLDSLVTSSPTSSNTYRNIFNTPISAVRCETSPAHSQISQFKVGNGNTVRATPNTADSSDNIDGEQSIPYSFPTCARSILINGPFAKRCRQSSTPSTSSSTCSSSSTSSPPSSKRVCFRDPLSEEIQTTQYILSHSDIPSRSASPMPETGVDKKSCEMVGTPKTPTSNKPSPKAREIALKILQPEADGSNDDFEDSGESSDSTDEIFNSPATPVTTRHKKDREWVWTLGPMQGAKGPGSPINLDSDWEEDLEASLGESVAAATAYSLS